jgi:hypothetical protein
MYQKRLISIFRNFLSMPYEMTTSINSVFPLRYMFDFLGVNAWVIRCNIMRFAHRLSYPLRVTVNPA